MWLGVGVGEHPHLWEPGPLYLEHAQQGLFNQLDSAKSVVTLDAIIGQPWDTPGIFRFRFLKRRWCFSGRC